MERTPNEDARIQPVNVEQAPDTRHPSDVLSLQSALTAAEEQDEDPAHREADERLVARLRQPELDGNDFSASFRPDPLKVAAADRIEAVRTLWQSRKLSD
jgi:hypothetical protein